MPIETQQLQAWLTALDELFIYLEEQFVLTNDRDMGPAGRLLNPIRYDLERIINERKRS